ncbi:hypothetical protein Anas_12992 [Armadillidium nasatum]|uniref:Uncharacterized protein n=1 Tax=Armadillidium nasatum TaxID=96803 RepID=A0A5N5T0E7_9CRUS|nr:hypothetical protein Anas_12992 [Armadillidium nasatum]
MCAGNMLYGTPPKELPFSTSECGNQTFSMYNFTTNIIQNNTSENMNEEASFESFPMLYLYDISYTLYSVFSPLFCVIIGLIISRLTRSKKSPNVPPELITPLLHKFYYKKCELERQSFS